MASAQRAGVATQLELLAGRAMAWDQIAQGELAFDFTLPPLQRAERALAETAPEKNGVREAIERWLEEQL